MQYFSLAIFGMDWQRYVIQCCCWPNRRGECSGQRWTCEMELIEHCFCAWFTLDLYFIFRMNIFKWNYRFLLLVIPHPHLEFLETHTRPLERAGLKYWNRTIFQFNWVVILLQYQTPQITQSLHYNTIWHVFAH